MIRQGWLIAFGFLISAAGAQAATPSVDGEFAAARLTQILSRSHSYKELSESMSAGGKDQAAIDAAYKQLGAFAPVSVNQPQAAVVSIMSGGHTTLVDFSGFEKDRVLVNGKVIHLTAEKNFLNYHSEITEILKQTSKTALLLKFTIAHANAAEAKTWGDSLPVWLGDFLDKTRPGGGAGLAIMSDPVVSHRLATDIIAAYKTDDSYFQDGANHYGPDANDPFSPLLFRCEKDSLQQMGHATLDAHKRMVISDGLTRTGPQSFRFATPMRSPDAQLDANFKVLQPGGRLVRGQNLLTVQNSDYGRFPEIAQKCCAMKGCYDQVMAGIQPVLQHAVKSQSNTSVQ